MAVVDAWRTGHGGVVVCALAMVAEAEVQIPVVPPVPAHVRAKEMLEKALELIAQPKPFCILVSDTIRAYLEERFNFHAPERTTEEFLHELRGTDLLSAEQKEKLGEFLECCDLVKFAKYEPGEPELRDLHGSALRLVEETEPVKAEDGESRKWQRTRFASRITHTYHETK